MIIFDGNMITKRGQWLGGFQWLALHFMKL